jgi:hypothetical protein
MKKCPPGVICVENISMIVLLISFCILMFLYFIYNNSNGNKVIVNNNQRENSGLSGLVSWPYTNLDPVLNPYSPPLRDERYFIPGFNALPSGAVPINVSTNVGAVDTSYRQVGILTPIQGTSKDNILALMGRPLFTNRDMWNYYTTSNQHNNVKLPIKRNGKSCTNEYGCDKLYNSDVVHIEGINEAYKVTIYDNSTMKYLPFL